MRTLQAKRNTILGLLLAVSSFAACNEASEENVDPSTENHTTIRSSLERETSPNVDASAVAQIAEGNRELSIELYEATAEDGENYMVSAASIQQAFALTYAGARGETATEIAATLHFDGEPAEFHASMNALDLALSSREMSATDEEEAVSLRVANAFWGQTGYPWEAGYLDILALNYGAGIEAVDFDADPELARTTINDWVEAKTADRIKNLLPEGSISDGTAAVLTNAVYFKAPWAAKFDEDSTRPGDFSLESGGSASAEFMHKLEREAYAAGEGWEALEMSFRGEELAMLFVLPAAGTFSAFDENLSAETFNTVIAALEPGLIDIALPKFTFESEFTLSDALKSLGMQIPFGGEADFTGMLADGGLFIDEAYHKTFIAVEEGGAEAAAATAVVVGETSAPVADATFVANRPFYFAIRDRETGLFLFFGRVMNPAE